VVVSHDRYFVERVCDDVYALDESGGIRHLPGGIEQYVELRQAAAAPANAIAAKPGSGPLPAAAAPSGAVIRTARKELQRLERALEKSAAREAALHEDMAAAATDHTMLHELQVELTTLLAERDDLEAAWMETSETLEG
jgi:ATP-binding cassette subfamily F protein uup